ncbi:MAG: DedA family protein [Alphaproteobacteria bacterium]|nr:DedA family protein [Alphaproteobacteria bacterium]
MPSPLRNCYDYLIKQSEGPYASVVLFAIAFAESSFFPIPPDVLLLPMALANRERAYRYALICTLGSVIGGLLGYAIGAFFFATFGQWIIDTYNMASAFQRFHDEFNEWGVWIILAKGFTPIPFKLVTIASGVAQLNIVAFVLAAIATRSARFYLVAFLAKKFGAPIKNFVERYLPWVLLGILAAIIFGFWLVLG